MEVRPVDIVSQHLPPVTCASWCVDQDGHRHEIFLADQGCSAPEARVTTVHGDVIAYLVQDVGGPVVVAVAVETDNPDRPVAELRLSVAAFRRFVELAQANVLDVAADFPVSE
jgi:hypothetical protein